MNPLILPSGSFFSMTVSITFALFLILAPKSASSVDDELYVNCSRTLTCGNIDNISYPFWGSDRPAHCGFPGFQLNCSGTAPEITIGLATYRVLRISNEFRVLTVFRADYVNTLCPTVLINTTLPTPIFEFNSDTKNLSLYYNCSENVTELFSSTCNEHNQTQTFYFRAQNPNQKDIAALGTCRAMVVLAANQSAIQSVETSQYGYVRSSDNLKQVLAEGFGLQWEANNSLCDQCIKSGGQCGYNTDLNKFSCYCADQPHESACPSNGPTATALDLKLKLIIGVAVPVAIILAISFMVLLFMLERKSSTLKSLIFGQIRKTKRKEERVKAFILEYGNSLGPKIFSYSEIKKITNSFSEKLGQGGFGTVYKGTLLDGRAVAVKVIKKSKGDGQDFINEVASISKTSHVNIVTLLGFCYERSKRALVYEFMPNGSLDKFIYNQGSPEENHQLGIKTLYEITVGIAEGLEYLHKGCNKRILHFDIKPHNILLDKNFCPKISDFGLAKLCETRESIVSMTGARGTFGYIAPEVFSRKFGGVSYKSDVYSYGMMVLEMIGGRKNVNAEATHTSEIYFPSWIYKQIEKAEKLNLDRVVDDEEEEEMTRKMVVVSLWCIQTIPSNRPSMTKVLEMLQGSLEALPLPPEPLLSSPGPAAVSLPQNSSTTSSVIMQVVSKHL